MNRLHPQPARIGHPSQQPLHIAFVIRSLDRGGSERQLIELARGLPKDRFRVSIVTFYDRGELFGEVAAEPNIQLVALGKQGRWDLAKFLLKFWSVLRQMKPDILHGYLGISNLLSTSYGKLTGTPVVWGLRASNQDLSQYDWLSSAAFDVGARLSRFADAIIVNSHAGKQYHAEHGYATRRMVVIPNGIDAQRFAPDRQAGLKVRAEWGIGKEELLIGIAARFDPVKDHGTFLRAAALMGQKWPQVRFVCVGDGPPSIAEQLADLARELGIATRILWVGARGDMPAVYNALDIVTSTSTSEGFSNSIGEAIACGVPCVVTDVGDSAILVRDAKRIIPPGDPEALSMAWSNLLSVPPEDRATIAAADRIRIVQLYSVATLVERTTAVLTQLGSKASDDRTLA